MAPLSIEIYHSEDKKWVRLGHVNPRDPPGSMSDNKPDGSRDIYMFECSSDNSKSTIYRSRAGLDTEVGPMRLLTTTDAEVIKELRKGDDPYEMKVKTDISSQPRLIRFTHV